MGESTKNCLHIMGESTKNCLHIMGESTKSSQRKTFAVLFRTSSNKIIKTSVKKNWQSLLLNHHDG